MRKIAALLIFISSACGAQQIASTNATGPAGSVIGYNAAGHNWLYVPVDTNGYLLVDCPGCTSSGSGLSGMTAGQIPVAATATTVTSSATISDLIVGQAIAPGVVYTPNVDDFYYGQPFYSSCTGASVGGGTYYTNGDCAFFTAKQLAINNGNPVTLYLGDGYWEQCQQWTQPSTGFINVNIKGTSMPGTFVIAQSVDGNGGACSQTTKAMLYKNGGDAFVTMENLTFLTNSNAGACFEYLDGIIGGRIENVWCQGTIPTATSGLDHLVQMGNPYTGGPTDTYAQDMVWHNFLTGTSLFGFPSGYASITGTGTTSLTGITINVAGSGYSSGHVVGIVNDPHHFCTVEPAFTVTINGSGVVTGTTITTAGTCSGGLPDLKVANQLAVTYGIKAYISDTHITNLEPGATITGALLQGGNVDLLHAHPTSIQYGIETLGSFNFNETECDTIYTACIAIDSVSNFGSKVEGTWGVQADPYTPGATVYKFASGVTNVNFAASSALCNLNPPVDYQEFLGPSGPLIPGGSGWPSGSTVLGNDHSCPQVPAAQQIDYDPYLTGVGLSNTTTAVSSGTQAANTCSSATTQTVTGLATTNVILPGFSGSPSALTGWGTTGGMVFNAWPSAANTMSWQVCNPTSASITYSAIPFNVAFR